MQHIVLDGDIKVGNTVRLDPPRISTRFHESLVLCEGRMMMRMRKNSRDGEEEKQNSEGRDQNLNVGVSSVEYKVLCLTL